MIFAITDNDFDMRYHVVVEGDRRYLKLKICKFSSNIFLRILMKFETPVDIIVQPKSWNLESNLHHIEHLLFQLSRVSHENWRKNPKIIFQYSEFETKVSSFTSTKSQNLTQFSVLFHASLNLVISKYTMENSSTFEKKFSTFFSTSYFGSILPTQHRCCAFLLFLPSKQQWWKFSELLFSMNEARFTPNQFIFYLRSLLLPCWGFLGWFFHSISTVLERTHLFHSQSCRRLSRNVCTYERRCEFESTSNFLVRLHSMNFPPQSQQICSLLAPLKIQEIKKNVCLLFSVRCWFYSDFLSSPIRRLVRGQLVRGELGWREYILHEGGDEDSCWGSPDDRSSHVESKQSNDHFWHDIRRFSVSKRIEKISN